MPLVDQKRDFGIIKNDLLNQTKSNSITTRKRLNNCINRANSNCSLSSTNFLNLCDVNSLPTDILYLIFNRIHLQYRITRLAIVCKRWNYVIEEMCSMKGSLTINLFNDYRRDSFSLFMEEDLERYSNVALEEFESIRENAKISDYGVLQCPDLSRIFINIKYLVIRCNDNSNVQNKLALQLFLELLHQKWPSNLEGLTLWKSTKIIDKTFLPRICNAINSAPWSKHLKRLDLLFKNLETLNVDQNGTFNIDHGHGEIILILTESKKITNVKDLHLASSLHYTIFLRSLSVDLLSSLSSSVTHLRTTSLCDPDWFTFICDHFSSLKYLQINYNWIHSRVIKLNYLVNLAKLKQLTELRFHNFILLPGLFPSNFVLPTVKKFTIVDEKIFWWFRKYEYYNPNNSNNIQLVTCASQDARRRFNADQYCVFLARHFSSVERLVLVCCEQNVTLAERQLRKFAYVHFKCLKKLCLILQAKDFNKN